MAEFGWAYVAGNVVSEAQGLTGSVLLKKGQTEISGSPNLVFNTGSNILELGGTLSASSAITASSLNLYGLSAGTAANTNSYLAIDSNFNIILTSSGTSITQGSAGSGGSGGGPVGQATSYIGNAEDGDYTDGLYTDFVPATPVGTAVDRFNEILKILAPSPSPSLSEINYDNSAGSTVKLSFGSSSPITGYTSSATDAGFDSVDIAQTYQPETSGSNFRLGVYNGTIDVTGFLNYSISESVTNGNIAYSNDAFGNANEGTLKLELNGTVIHSVSLPTLSGSGDPNSGSAVSLTGDSGFTHISVTASSYDGNGSEWYLFKHRTAKYKIDVNDQNVGWNYARVIHTIGTTNYETNYVEWINDPSGSVNDLSISNPRIEDIVLIGSKHLSGVEYNTDATAKYKADINNLYRNVYQVSGTPISFIATNSSNPAAQSVPDINTGLGEDYTKVLGVTASLDYNGNSLINSAITCNTTVSHPFKATISTTGSATTGNGFLIDNRTLSSTNTSEKFHDETFRKQSGSFDLQTDISGPSYDWDSSTHMDAGGYSDGLLFFNQRLYSPIDADIPAGGNFSSLTNVESGQPNYSSITGTRTFYRKIQNTTLADLYNLRIQSTKSGTTYNNSSLGTGNVHIFVKAPETTGWMDVTQAFTYGNISDGDGSLISAASDANSHVVSFGTASVSNGDYIIIKIVADSSWTGYISQLDFTLPANQSQATPNTLSDINAAQTGASVKLSFGSLNEIQNYSSVTGSGTGSMQDIDSNELYSVSNDRRGVFTSSPTITGIINDAIGAGSGYPNDAFYNGYSGSLVLEVNGVDVHTVVLNNTLSSIPNNLNSNGSGFDLSAVSFSTLSNIPHYTKPYRTGTYTIAAGDQNVGWNYARIKHGLNTTNYVEWVVDASASIDDTSVSTPILSDFTHDDTYYQSGIGYFASRPTATFIYTASNFYTNTYQNGDAINFPITDRCSISNVRIEGSGISTFNGPLGDSGYVDMPSLNNNDGCQTEDIEITGTVLFDSLTSISGGLGLFTDYDVSVSGKILHPFKSDRTTATSSKTSFMVYSGSNGSTNLNTNEYFNTENYRIVSGNYSNQTDVTSSLNSWDSTSELNAGDSYDDGMVTVNGYAISPLMIGNSGDTRNVSDGGVLQAPSGNPNYSSLNNSIRTYYRYFRNETGLSKATFSVKLYGDATIVAKSGAFYTGTLGANKNINVEIKVPYDSNFTGLDDTSTAWGDAVKPYSAGTQPTTDGVGIYSGGGTGLDQSVDDNGTTVGIQLQEKQVRDDQYFVVKISAHKDWTGYLSRIEIIY